MKTKKYFILALTVATMLPTIVHAQVSAGVDQLHTVLDNVYNQMIPLCSQLLGLCQAIASFGVIFYIGIRVWKHIANAESIDFFPLFRPFVMVILIGIFPQVLAIMNGILSPSVTATAAIVKNSNDAVQTLLIEEAATMTTDTTSVLIAPNPQANGSGWDKYSQPGSTTSDSGGGFWSAIGSGFKFLAGGLVSSLRFIIKFFLSILLEILYYAASLCIDTIRTFHLIVLAVMGPFAFAFSCYDGFQTSLTHWIGKYINVYLWLPVANLLGAILGKIQENMLQVDLARAQSGSLTLFSPTDFAYLIFLAIGIVGYTTIPGLTGYIVHSHLPNPLVQKATEAGKAVAGAAVGAATGGAGGAAVASSSGGSSGGGGGFETNGKGQPYDPYQYNRDKISG